MWPQAQGSRTHHPRLGRRNRQLLRQLDDTPGGFATCPYQRRTTLDLGAADQTLRFWDTSTWKETKLLRGHTDLVGAVAISEQAHLVASTGQDGNLMLWEEDGKSGAGGYSRLSEELRVKQLMPLDHSRVLLLPPGKPPELLDLKHDSAAVSLPEIGDSTNVLGGEVRGEFGTNIICHWNGTNQILVHELRGAELIQRGAIALDSGTRPFAFATSPRASLWRGPTMLHRGRFTWRA
jgi:WD40 repeat protein